MIANLPQRSTEPERPAIDVEPVPTVKELAERKGAPVYATVVGRNTKGEPTHWALTQAGTALLGGIMRRNGQALAAAEAARPAISHMPPMTAKQQAYIWARDAFGES